MSTFTDWNGPQGGNVRAMDLIELANAYSNLVTKLNEHLNHTASSDNVHSVKSYVEQALAALEIPSIEGLLKETDAANIYQTKIPDLNDFVRSAALNSYVTITALDTALADYLKTSDLSTQDVITAIRDDIVAIQTALSANPFEKPILKATEYVEGLIHAVEQVKFTFKQFGATVGGSDDRGVFYILGMIDDRAGTAYIRYTDDKSFAAVIHFAVTAELDAQSRVTDYLKGQLSITTDSADLTHLHFKIVKGSDENGMKHVYLAIQADEWFSQFASSDGVGLFETLPFEGAGINFIPVDGIGYKRPNGATDILYDVDYRSLEDKVDAFETMINNMDEFHGVGTIVAWPKLNDNGIPVGFDSDCYHVCDGANIPDNPKYDAVRAIVGSKFPKVDYCVIQIREVVKFN